MGRDDVGFAVALVNQIQSEACIDVLALLFEIRTEPSRGEGPDRNER
jgi:hypothetical protein